MDDASSDEEGSATTQFGTLDQPKDPLHQTSDMLNEESEALERERERERERGRERERVGIGWQLERVGRLLPTVHLEDDGSQSCPE